MEVLKTLIEKLISNKEIGIDCAESESAEIKYFLRTYAEFTEYFGKEHGSKESNILVSKIIKLFPIEASEVLEEL